VLVLILSLVENFAMAQAQVVRAGFPQLNGGQTPLWTISEAKLDRKYGIEVRPIYIPGGARLTQTVVSRDVDIALTGGAVINAILGGADLVFVGVAVPTYAFSLTLDPISKQFRTCAERSSASLPKARHRTTHRLLC
jgi:ABC-type nitrate/sulfonate/bicarbonate transport system substrate-binding protein